MRAEEIMIRSEIRQMLNEAGLNRESLREIVREAIEEIVKKQLDLEEQRGKFTSEIHKSIDYKVKAEVKEAIRERLRYIGLRVTVDIPETKEKENDT